MTKHTTTEMRKLMANQVRKAQGSLLLTNKELAEKANVSLSIINHLRNEKGNPGINNIHRVYDALGLKRIEL